MRYAAISILMLGIFIVLAPALIAQPYFWTSLDGPYWIKGIDVAYGYNVEDHAWHRYLAGNDGGETEVFYWRDGDARWLRPDVPAEPLPANKLISYKAGDNSHIAFCSVYEDDIWRTLDGGVNWDPREFDGANKQFTSIEVPHSEQNAGNVVMVATEGVPNVASTYYTEDGGASWQAIGDNSTGWQVNDIEAYPDPVYPPNMAIGTSDGIYNKCYNGWDGPWVQALSFQGVNVPVLESIDGWDQGKQLAAVQNGENGTCELYYSNPGGENPWADPIEIKILPDGHSFNHRVRDMSAVYWYQSYVSCYVATDEGLFLLTYSNPEQATVIDLDYAPLKYDTDVQAVDYYFKAAEQGQPYDTAFVLAATAHSVYQVIEVRDKAKRGIISVTASEIVQGTYLVCPPTGAQYNEPTKNGN